MTEAEREMLINVHSTVNNGLKDNVTEIRADVKHLSVKVDELSATIQHFYDTREQTCPYAADRRKLGLRRKSDWKWIIAVSLPTITVVLTNLLL
jgi:hypothetical protein